MALGTITLVKDAGGMPSAPSFADALSFAGDGAYPTGGTAGFAALVQAKSGDTRQPYAVIPVGLNGGYNAIYDLANDKLLVEVKSSGVEVANAVDLSATTFKVVVLSR